jgi:hypothetical protein
VLCLVVAAAGLIAPFINAAAFGGRIQGALESSLGRKVTFEEVRFTLFSGPGFSLTNVIIDEDPRFGLEPFAYVPVLQARIRVDALLRGRLAFSSLRMDELGPFHPSLNVVKREDGTWNVVELLSRLTAPSRLPIDLFPACALSGGRLDFKIGAKKTTLYVTDTDVSVYPQRSGKLYIQFSGSPARTDRAGSGFGHIRGLANWYQRPASPEANQLEMDVTLDPSNLSELTTLVEGHDVGIHGTVSSRARIEGPAAALRLTGDLSIGNVRRWDLLPSAGEGWRVRYQGAVDLAAHSLTLRTVPAAAGDAAPVALQVRVNDFLSKPSWSMIAALNKAPAAELLPISRRMGVPIPEELKLAGMVDGVVGYSKETGFSGAVELSQGAADLPNTPTLRAPSMTVRISSERIQFEPTEIDTGSTGSIQVGGEYDAGAHRVAIRLQPTDLPVETIRDTISAWLGSPGALDLLRAGSITTGQINFDHTEGAEPLWSGQFRFADGELQPSGIGQPLTAASGQVHFDATSLEVEKLSATLGSTALTGSYHRGAGPRGTEHVHLEAATADLRDIESALEPTLRAQGFLARLGMTRREIPAWLSGRHLQVDLTIGEFSVAGTVLGPLRARLGWTGPRIQFPVLELKLPDGVLRANGTLDVAASAPLCRFSAAVSGYRWRGGVLSAEGTFQTSGTGADALEHLRAEGTFSGQDVSPDTEDMFTSVSGAFDFTFARGWPDLRISRLEASQGDEAWTGAAASQSDGKLVIDLEREGKQRRVISSLEPQSGPISSALIGPASAR